MVTLAKFVKYKMKRENNITTNHVVVEVIIGEEVVVVAKKLVIMIMMITALKLFKMTITVLKQFLKKAQVQTKSTLKKKNTIIIKGEIRVVVITINKATNLAKTKTKNINGEVKIKGNKKMGNHLLANNKKYGTKTKEMGFHPKSHH